MIIRSPAVPIPFRPIPMLFPLACRHFDTKFQGVEEESEASYSRLTFRYWEDARDVTRRRSLRM